MPEAEHLTVGEYSRSMALLNEKIDKEFTEVKDIGRDLEGRTAVIEEKLEAIEAKERHVRASDHDPLTRRDLNVAVAVATAIIAIIKWVIPFLQKAGQ